MRKEFFFQAWEARHGGLPKDGRVQFELEQRGARETLEDRTVLVSYGEDLVNVFNVSFVARDVAIAEVAFAFVSTSQLFKHSFLDLVFGYLSINSFCFPLIMMVSQFQTFWNTACLLVSFIRFFESVH